MLTLKFEKDKPGLYSIEREGQPFVSGRVMDMGDSQYRISGFFTAAELREIADFIDKQHAQHPKER